MNLASRDSGPIRTGVKGGQDWKSEYESKFITAEEVANLVKSGDKILFTSGREALTIGLAIAARKEELKGVKIIAPTPSFDFGWYDEGWQDSFDVTVRMVTGTCQDAMDNQRVDFDPGSMIPYVEMSEAYNADILLTEISAPDARGFCSFGSSLWAKKAQMKRAKKVIAEVNPKLIRTYGDNYVHVSEFDHLVMHEGLGGSLGTGSLAGRALKQPEPYLGQITKHVSSLIQDGDTLQIGVGRTTEPLVKLGLLDGKNDIGWHSEATPAGVISLVRDGVINGKRKSINQGKAVVTSIGGSSKEEMEWVDGNPLFWLVSVDHLEDIRVIADHDNFVAINNALVIDLSGQIGAETLGTRQMAGAGGQIAFVFGSWLSKGGRSITVLPSTAGGGRVSRILPTMPNGTAVTIQRNCADYIVTEYGIARLRGKTLRERASALISVAHPDFRSSLKAEAVKLWGEPSV